MELNFRANLPQKLYKAQQVSQNEAAVPAALGIEMFTLMEKAGHAVFALIQSYFHQAQSMTVLCGYGNNGGDGYIVARLAKQAGWQVKLIQLGDGDKVSGDAKRARQLWLDDGGTTADISSGIAADTVLVDAMLGSGLSGDVRGIFAQVIPQINNIQHKLVCSVDLPSGLNADTGMPMGCAIEADCTCTFIGMKQGLLTGKGPDYCGQLCFAGLDMAQAFEQMVPASAMTPNYSALMKSLPPRKPSSHKGQFGHVLLVGGNKGMSGAIRMAARACLRTGAGLVSVHTHPDNLDLVAADCAEVMVGTELEYQLQRADVIVFGPGAGQDEWSSNLLNSLIDSDKPMVIDADGLNLLAKIKSEQLKTSAKWVLTPHPKEAARLLDSEVAQIQQDRFVAVSALSDKYNAVVLLKGVGTLVCGRGNNDEKFISVNTTGNPGMATAGMGDVLSGIIGGLLAQGLSGYDAARFGALIHGLAGDEAALPGQRGMMATDLIDQIRSVINDGTG